MNKIIEQLYNGNIYPAELIISSDPEYIATHKWIDKELTILKEVLPPEDLYHLKDLEKLYLTSSSMTCFAGFSYGLKLGIQLMSEAYSEDGQPLYHKK